jgi:hypothetical protein
MGLNWSQGAENAAAGLDRMAKQKNIDAERAYQEMAQRNRERFRSKESEIQRDFLSDEAGARREWEGPFKEKGLELQEQQIEVSGDIRKIQTEMQGEQNKISNYWQQQSHELAKEKTGLERQRVEGAAEIATATEQRLTAKQWMADYDTEMERLIERRQELETAMTGAFRDKAKDAGLQAELDKIKATETEMPLKKERALEVIKLGGEKEALYDEAFEAIGGDPSITHDIAIKYAKLSDTQRGQMDNAVTALQTQYPEKLTDPKKAWSAAIIELDSGKTFPKASKELTPKEPPPEVPPGVGPPADTPPAVDPSKSVTKKDSWLNKPIADFLKTSPEEERKMEIAIGLATKNGHMSRKRISPQYKERYMKEAEEILRRNEDFLASSGGLPPIDSPARSSGGTAGGGTP